MQPRGSVDRRPATLSLDEFQNEYAGPGRPVILTGAMGAWPAWRRWSLEFFRDRCGDAIVTVRREEEKKDMPLREFIEYMQTTTDAQPWYLAGWSFAKDDASLLDDYRVLPYFGDNWAARLPDILRPDWRWIYMAPAGAMLQMHFDVWKSNGWIAMFSGRKRWLYFPPGEAEHVYHGQADAFVPDLSRFPLLAEARGFEGVQEAGEIMFTPSGWWHQVFNEIGGFAVTENYVDATSGDAFRRFIVEGLPREAQVLVEHFIPELSRT